MSFRYIAGLLGKAPVVVGPVGGEGGSAPGAWNLSSQANLQAQGLWPQPPLPKQLWSWGESQFGELGLGNLTNYSSPKQIGSETVWAQVSTGRNLSFAIKLSGTMWSWGLNSVGALGLNSATYSFSTPQQIGALTTWYQVSSGSNCCYAIKTDGTLWAWGQNTQGKLGIGNSTTYSSPKQVGVATNWAKVSGGAGSAYAIKTGGTLWSWGANGQGQLGLNDTTYRNSPVQIGALTTWSKVSSGNSFCAAIKTDGTLWTWGMNYFGQLGLGNTVYRSSPLQVGALTNWYEIAGGTNSLFAVKTDGTLWGWGKNSAGELGLGNTTYAFSSPQQIGSLTNWLNISSGNYYCLALKTDKTLWSWGSGSTGKLGLGNTTNYSSPKQVGALTTWLKLPIAIGSTHSIAIKSP